jgi:hypothetical protein
MSVHYSIATSTVIASHIADPFRVVMRASGESLVLPYAPRCRTVRGSVETPDVTARRACDQAGFEVGRLRLVALGTDRTRDMRNRLVPRDLDGWECDPPMVSDEPLGFVSGSLGVPDAVFTARLNEPLDGRDGLTLINVREVAPCSVRGDTVCTIDQGFDVYLMWYRVMVERGLIGFPLGALSNIDRERWMLAAQLLG